MNEEKVGVLFNNLICLSNMFYIADISLTTFSKCCFKINYYGVKSESLTIGGS